MDAEKRLIALYDKGIIRDLVILRLAPVYDCEWSLNLDRRVFAPWKLTYLRFGTDLQRMSALARPNLVDFIKFLLDKQTQNSGINILNVCDADAYEFNKIIQVFKNSGIRPTGPVISIPLYLVWLGIRIVGSVFSNKRKWIHSCYDKLTSDLVFDNGRMMSKGFRPKYSLETIFNSQLKKIE